MAPSFLAFEDPAGKIDHVLLPHALPHATTHLPDAYDDGLSLSVFRNTTHSIVRIRIFESYALLSALPDGSSKVCIHTPTGQQIEVPQSTTAETIWFVLEEGVQFTYAAIRCSVEFDRDNPISNLMPPPDIFHPAEEVLTLGDTDMLQDKTMQEPVTTDDPVSADTSRPKANQFEKSGNVFKMSLGVEGHTKETPSEIPLAKRNPGKESRSFPVPSLMTSSARALREPSQILQPMSVNRVISPRRQAGEESQVLEKQKTVSRIWREAGKQSQVLQASEPASIGFTATNSSKDQFMESQAISNARLRPEPENTFPGQHAGQTTVIDDGTRTLEQESSSVHNGLNVRQHMNVGGKAPQQQIGLSLIPTEGLPAPQQSFLHHHASIPTSFASNEHHKKSSDVVIPPKQRKRPMLEPLDVADTGPTKHIGRSNESPDPLHQIHSDDGDTTTASEHEDQPTNHSTIVVSVPPRSRVKRRRVLRSMDRRVSPPPPPPGTAIVFSTKCDIQNKKKTMKTFLDLGGKVCDDISDADLLCVSSDGELKKTPKFVLAIILGKSIVTEDWVVECSRHQRFVDTATYMPQDEQREEEWSFKLSDAMERGKRPERGLTQLFVDHKLFLTPQLQHQLRRTGNLAAFSKVASAMGFSTIRNRLPVVFRPKMIVLGVPNDVDGPAARKLGHILYDKDLLTMSALRGARQNDTSEFEIGMAIKEEEY